MARLIQAGPGKRVHMGEAWEYEEDEIDLDVWVRICGGAPSYPCVMDPGHDGDHYFTLMGEYVLGDASGLPYMKRKVLYP